MLNEKYATEIQSILARYPANQKRAALMPLLYLAQREGGYVTHAAMQEIAALCGVDITEVASLIGF